MGDLEVLEREKKLTAYLPGHTLVDYDSDLTLCSCGEEGPAGIYVHHKWKWMREHKARLIADMDEHIRLMRPAPKALPFEGALGSLVIRRYWTDVIDGPVDKCWDWGGVLGRGGASKGYGRISVPGRPQIMAHRVSHLIHHGDIPAGLDVLHACDNPPCTNPAHLRAGTHQENMRDLMERQGVWNRGRPLRNCRRGRLMEGDNVLIIGTARGRICKACLEWRESLYKSGMRVN